MQQSLRLSIGIMLMHMMVMVMSSISCANFVGIRVVQLEGASAQCMLQRVLGVKEQPHELRWFIEEGPLHGPMRQYSFSAQGDNRRDLIETTLYDSVQWKRLSIDSSPPWQNPGPATEDGTQYSKPSVSSDTAINVPVARLVLRENSVVLYFLTLYASSTKAPGENIITTTPPLEVAALLYNKANAPTDCGFSMQNGAVHVALSPTGRSVAIQEQLPDLQRVVLADIGPPIARHLGRFAYDFHLQRRYKNAAQWWERALTYNPADNDMRYNWACALARLGYADEALRELRYLVARKPQQFAPLLMQDVDFESLRETPAFKALLHTPLETEDAEN